MNRTAVMLFLLGSVMCGQTPTASVVGRITDVTGAVLPNLSVQVTNLDTNQTSQTTSNGLGDYTIPYLRPGRYSLEAQGLGFRVYKRSEFILDVEQSLRLDIAMSVGATTETITVTDTPPVLTTETGARGDVTTNQEITDIPLAGRNFTDLAYLTGGVAPKGEDGDGAFAINGARADNVGFLVDGMNNTQRRNTTSMVSPPIEGIQEFKLTTSGFSAEYGRYAGGILSVVTKSGGNRLRGSLYEFVRNDLLDARNFFDVDKSKLRLNQFGATVSGPVVLPKLYNGKNKTFFIVSWESLRQVSGSTQRGIVPLPEYLSGDFSKALDSFGKPLKILDPLAKNAPFPDNRIPLTRLDPVALRLANFYPKPNLTGANNFVAQGNASSRFNNYTIKVDHALSDRDRLTFSTFWKPSQKFDPFTRTPIQEFGSTTDNFGILAGARYLRTISPSLFNEAAANFSRSTLFQGFPDNTRPWAQEVGFTGGTSNPLSQGLPSIDVSGYITIGHAYDLPKVWAYNNYQYSDTLTWIKGRNHVKFGGDFLRYQYFNKGYNNSRGRLTFLGRFTGEPMADFLLGYAQSTSRQLDSSREYLLVSNYSAFVQDDVKLTSSLTLNIGLRYDLLKQPIEKYGARSAFVPELGKIVTAGGGGLANFDELIQQTGLAAYVARASDVGLPFSIARTNYGDLGPRFGFAWRPFGNSKAVLRGGYGIFFGTGSLYRYDELSSIYPFSINESYSATTSNPLLLTVSNAFPSSKRKVGGITSASGQDVNAKDQYLQSWSLTAERELPGALVLELAYAGSKGTHLTRRYDVNQPNRTPALKQPDGTFPRAYPVFSTINYFAAGSNSIYNSGSATVRRRLSREFFIRAAYTYAKSLDDTSNTGGTIAAGFPTAQDSRNLRLERGRSDFDIGHSFLASFIWQQTVWKNIVVRGWQVSGTTRAYTGAPFTPKVANASLDLGDAVRPDRIAKGTLDSPSSEAWYDRNAFPVVPRGSFRYGNSGRNVLDGPGGWNVDAALSRRFRVKESTVVQFRFETFNVLNRANFNLPQTQVDVLNSATISQAKSPRILQLGLRLEF